MLGLLESTIAGGMENMDMAPYLIGGGRWGRRLPGWIHLVAGLNHIAHHHSADLGWIKFQRATRHSLS